MIGMYMLRTLYKAAYFQLSCVWPKMCGRATTTLITERNSSCHQNCSLYSLAMLSERTAPWCIVLQYIQIVLRYIQSACQPRPHPVYNDRPGHSTSGEDLMFLSIFFAALCVWQHAMHTETYTHPIMHFRMHMRIQNEDSPKAHWPSCCLRTVNPDCHLRELCLKPHIPLLGKKCLLIALAVAHRHYSHCRDVVHCAALTP